MTKDCSLKRACFISKVHSLNQEFYFSDPYTLLRLYNIYTFIVLMCANYIHPGIWLAVKVLFDLPRETHRYFIEPVSETLHLKTMLCSRFLSFFNSLQTSNKMAVRLLSNLCKNNRMTYSW